MKKPKPIHYHLQSHYIHLHIHIHIHNIHNIHKNKNKNKNSTDLRDDQETVSKLQRMRQRPISVQDGEKMARELRAVKYTECSAYTQRNLKSVFDDAIVAALNPNASGGGGGGHKKKKACMLM